MTTYLYAAAEDLPRRAADMLPPPPSSHLAGRERFVPARRDVKSWEAGERPDSGERLGRQTDPVDAILADDAVTIEMGPVEGSSHRIPLGAPQFRRGRRLRSQTLR